jgi:hypothetical protein
MVHRILIVIDIAFSKDGQFSRFTRFFRRGAARDSQGYWKEQE